MCGFPFDAWGGVINEWFNSDCCQLTVKSMATIRLISQPPLMKSTKLCRGVAL